MAEQVQTLIFFVLFDSQLPLVVTRQHRMGCLVTTRQTQDGWKKHLAADALRPLCSEDTEDYNGEGTQERKTISSFHESTDILEKHHVNCKNTRLFPPRILSLDRTAAISDFLQVVKIAK